ncbi:exodeoxyribonuclease V subunit alpha [Francisella sp. Scap27]|uniref:exodeoxyribonuclease V subunit alpha n=1 Tax=Francisella sp. Scap27 TaxID=2589986 RepID=UPI0015C09FBF|nr:exodeoxyribonuclease V subunit alpha [Francisella sp. Scap27]QLE79610.1 exodeoxyribonuclease V subunit alpha [Francisella sp. Scap27]
MIYSSYAQAKKHLDNLEAIDYFFAKQVFEFFENIDKSHNIQLFHLLMCLQKYYSDGHTCLPLNKIANKTLWNTKEDSEDNQVAEIKAGFAFADIDTFKNIVTSLTLDEKSPISFHYDCLYINRLWLFENEIANNLVARALNTHSKTQETQQSNEQIKAILDALFAETKEVDWQKVAVAKSIKGNFSIISGGPGTGKTTTVAKLILALQQLSNKRLDIQMIAPTGKASQRLKESIANFKNANQNLDMDALPTEAKTLHRFLGMRPNSNYIKYNQERKSNCDVLIVDEASMIDINSFIYIIRAIKSDCKLVLLGDVNQLPSVETGNILAELAKACDDNHYTKYTVEYLKEICGYSLETSTKAYDFTTFLQKSYRTDSQDILAIAKDVISGDVKNYHSNAHIDYQILETKNYDKQVEDFIKNVCLPEFKKIQTAESPQQALDVLKQFRVLVANRNIATGTQVVNQKIAKYLNQNEAFSYHCKPIMITVNDYNSRLFNGDVGVIWRDKAYFEAGDGQLRELGLSRLPKHETVYAMTIHKTQGSEFDHVAIILPNEHNRLLTRELLYTGITRAKSKVYIRTSAEVWQQTVVKKVNRHSNISKIMQDIQSKADSIGES